MGKLGRRYLWPLTQFVRCNRIRFDAAPSNNFTRSYTELGDKPSRLDLDQNLIPLHGFDNDMGYRTIRNVNVPVSVHDVATKGYADQQIVDDDVLWTYGPNYASMGIGILESRLLNDVLSVRLAGFRLRSAPNVTVKNAWIQYQHFTFSFSSHSDRIVP